MGQKRPDVDVPSSPLVIPRLCVVDDGDKPISVLSEVKNYVPIDIIGVLKEAPNLRKIVPSNSFDYHCPRFDFVGRIRIAIDGFTQMPSGYEVHLSIVLHIS